MAKSFPPDVLVFDSESLLHARLGRGRKNPQIVHVKRYLFPGTVFASGAVTPSLTDPVRLDDVIRRVKIDNGGQLNQVVVLLPDAWFRINLLTLPTLPPSRTEADQVIRWTLKKSLPIDSAALRVAYNVINRNGTGVKSLVISALETTLSGIEGVLRNAGIQVSVIESVGLNIWNAISVRQQAGRGRLLLLVREDDFTTAVFDGDTPLFIRSRSLSGDRKLIQEIKLSASYLQGILQNTKIEECFVAGNRLDPAMLAAVGEEFGAPVRRASLADFADIGPGLDTAGADSELIACAGVYAE
ncbi:MAG TPA: hypothetical protein VHL58_04405 [Thermoanaerobaculia bacterium]|nr:hypothetical protein [Thermoanaerobaculia bacterium]